MSHEVNFLVPFPEPCHDMAHLLNNLGVRSTEYCAVVDDLRPLGRVILVRWRAMVGQSGSKIRPCKVWGMQKTFWDGAQG